MDANSADSLAHLAEDTHGSGGAIEDADLPHVARWHDVHEAAVEIAGSNWLAEVTGELADGDSQATIAGRAGHSQPSLSRRYRASMEQLLVKLNTPARAAA